MLSGSTDILVDPLVTSDFIEDVMSKSRGDVMIEPTEASAIATKRQLRFKIRGLDCQNEVRLLKEALLPLGFDERHLSFQPKRGLLDIEVEAVLEVEAVIAAVSTTGMTAEWQAPGATKKDETTADECSGCSGDRPPVEQAR